MWFRNRIAVSLLLLSLWMPAIGLGSDAHPEAAKTRARPNVLWIVWDTVRADRLSLYGYERPTTPHLATWARGARVFEDCISGASSTVPSHASMFTGLLPSEHGTHSDHRYLDDAHTTFAERLRAAGYRTYLFAANPHISRDENFVQGFQVAEHPWDAKNKAAALRIVRAKIDPRDRSSELPKRVQRNDVTHWSIKAAGELAQSGLEAWLQADAGEAPWFAFLNYMEAHRPFLPSQAHRQRMMDEAQVVRSYTIDRSWFPMWAYVFRVGEYAPSDLDVMAATYDATLAELDDLFHALITSLERRGELANTVVVLTADHGEHLGEHHLLDHQYSLYAGLIHVPLVVHYPPVFAAGRDRRPVANYDLFPTLLGLAGVETASVGAGHARDLRDPASKRGRIAEYPAAMKGPLRMMRRARPLFDDERWKRTLRALHRDGYKYIWASNGEHELYHLAADPLESTNLVEKARGVAETMARELDDVVAALRPASGTDGSEPKLTPEQRKRLESLGYLDPEPEPGVD